jgi:hypothetical protein
MRACPSGVSRSCFIDQRTFASTAAAMRASPVSPCGRPSSPGEMRSSRSSIRRRSRAPWYLRASAAWIAPQPSWPRTTKSGVCRCTAAYCSEPITSGEITFPATRTVNSSPKPASNSSSGGTRESLQPMMVA